MHKKLVLLITMLCCSVPLLTAQTVMLMPHGVSPAGVKADTVGNPNYVGLFDRTYNGLLNVGVETQMYLRGVVVDTTLENPVWTVVQQPEGSAATLGAPVTVGNSQVTVFTPDVEGTYVVEFADLGTSAQVTINAALYQGIEDGRCALCHKPQADEWRETGHLTLFLRGVSGQAGSYYAERCIACHTTGYDKEAANNGFDDHPFVFPAVLSPEALDTLKMKYPEAMKFAGVQCESCHGPGSAHMGETTDSKMVSSLVTANCGLCHDDDHYHVYPSQWTAAGHANITTYPGGSRTNCQGCHNGAQFIQFVEGQPITVQPHVNITCAVCHDPHGGPHEYQLRTVDATLANGEKVMAGGNGKLCMNCHQNRRDAKTYTNSPRAHYGPHYAPQADILLGKNAVTFGKHLPNSPHVAGLEDACIDCHMYEKGAHGEHDAEGELNTAGMHSFSMVSKKGVDNVAACEDCHGNVGETFDEKKFYWDGQADHDGDGTEEGLQEEVHGLIDKLGAMLPSDDPHADVDSTWTLTELKAAFNHRMVYYDHSFGIHNPAFTVALLKVTIQALMNNAIEGEIVAIEDVPNDQGKQVRIIWDKFVDDGVAVEPVVSYLVKRLDHDDVWTGVGVHPADGSKRYALVVPTLFDSTDAGDGVTAFKIVALTRGGMKHESMPGEGYSVDNLVPQAPVGLVALLSNNDVNLTWEAPEDLDINYYRVFRGTSTDFVADENSEIGSTTELAFIDQDLMDGNYFYKVAAVDFSGNLGEMSDVVNTEVATSVDGHNKAPTDFALSQNFPNPFNPETTINFSLKNAGYVTITVYNTLGQKITTLVNKHMETGRYAVNFSGNGLSSGEYLYRIEVKGDAGNAVQYQQMRKMILMK